MEEERISKIKVGDVEYELILTTKATKSIAFITQTIKGVLLLAFLL